MNVSKSPLRRATALAAGSLIGIAGAVAFASPALAHHNEVSGTYTCDKVSGQWEVTWTAKAVGDGPFAWNAVTLTPAGTTIAKPTQLAVTGEKLTNWKKYTGKQLVPGKEKSASLTVGALWDNTHTASKKGDVFFKGECKAPAKPPTSASPSPSISPSAPASVPPSGSVSVPPSGSVSTPPSASTAPSTPVSPSVPVSPSASVSPSTPVVVVPDLPEITEEDIIVKFTCDTMTLGLHNPSTNLDFTLGFKTSKGETRTVTVKPGETKSETFSATEGFKVDWTFSVTVNGQTESETITVPFAAGADCTDGEGGGLPVTGAAAGGVAAGAAGLLAVGGALFFMARRRKVKFTA